MTYYVTLDFFNQYCDQALTPFEFDKKIELAQEKIDEVTYNRIVGIGFDKLTPFQQDKIKKATCHQLNYILENGIESFDVVSSYSVLDISVTVNANDKREAEKLCMSSMAYTLLKKTGLTNRNFKWR